MKMRNLFWGVILGLLAVVYSSPISAVTQDDVYREAVTDGYLVDHDFETSLVTESPKTNTTVQPSQQPTVSDDIEASGVEDNDESMHSNHGREHFPTTTPQAEILQSSWAPDKADSTDSDMMEGSADDSNWSLATMFPIQGNEEDATTTSSTTEIPQSVSSSSDLIEDSTDSNSVFLQQGNEEDATTTSSTTEIPESVSLSDMVEDSTDSNSVFLQQGHEEDATTTSTTTEIPESFSSSDMVEDSTDSNSVFLQQGHEEDATTTSTTTEIPESISSSSDIMEDSTDSNSVFLQPGNEEDASTTIASVPSEDESSITPDIIANDPIVATEDFQTSGSGDVELMSSTEPSTLSSTIMGVVNEEIARKISIHLNESPIMPAVSQVSEAHKEDTESQNAGHSTPGWIIIVGFIVGLTALVMLCVAIATRHKWNGPRQVSQPQPSSSNQQRELEMETFLHKEMPKENGKAAEYTVIPLDEFPEKFSSH